MCDLLYILFLSFQISCFQNRLKFCENIVVPVFWPVRPGDDTTRNNVSQQHPFQRAREYSGGINVMQNAYSIMPAKDALRILAYSHFERYLFGWSARIKFYDGITSFYGVNISREIFIAGLRYGRHRGGIKFILWGGFLDKMAGGRKRIRVRVFQRAGWPS